MKLEDAATLFLGSYDNLRTRRNYSETIKPLISWLGPSKDVQQVTAIDLHIYVQYIRDRPARWSDHPIIPEKEGQLAPATVDKHIRVIKRFFNYCIEVDLLAKSPAESLKQKRQQENVDRDKAATPEEIEILLRVAFGQPERYALARFMVDTAARARGAAELKISDLELNVCRAWVIEKGDKRRPVWYSAETAVALDNWLQKRQAYKTYKHDFLFGTVKGPRTPASISQIIRRLFIAGDARSLGTHSLRHAKAYQLSDANISPTVAATALGHESPETTMRHYYPADYVRAEEAMRKTHQRYGEHGDIND